MGAQLTHTLAVLGVVRMVVAHNPHLEGIQSACDARVWQIDVGMASFYGGSPAALEIHDGRVSVLD